MKSAFEKAHKAQFGFIDQKKDLVIEAVSVEAVGGGAKFTREGRQDHACASSPRPTRRTRFFSDGQWHKATVYTREQLAPGHKVPGPAIVIEPHQTVVVEPGWQAAITREEPSGAHAREDAQAHARDRHQGRSDHARGVQQPVHVDRRADGRRAAEHRLFGEHQGAARLLLRGVPADGALVANAPHMPVHLGSMDRAVETVIRDNKVDPPGDVFAINAPYNGGTHLPDITVCTPVFDDRKKSILFWVASRGHHADVGGISPGSMSPNATTIEQEGVYIDNFKLVDQRPLPREGTLRPPARREISGAQSAAERQRHQGADRRQREGPAGAAQDGDALHAAGGEGLHGARAGQRGRKRAPRHRPPARLLVRISDGPRHHHQGEDHGRQEESARRPSTSPARRRSRPTTSTRRGRSRARPCSTCSA